MRRFGPVIMRARYSCWFPVVNHVWSPARTACRRQAPVGLCQSWIHHRHSRTPVIPLNHRQSHFQPSGQAEFSLSSPCNNLKLPLRMTMGSTRCLATRTSLITCNGTALASNDSSNQNRGWTFLTKWLAWGGVLAAGILYQVYRSEVAAEESQTDQTSSTIQNTGQKHTRNSLTLQEAIELSRDLVQRIKDEVGSPGLTVGVSVDGHTVWAEGLGYSDVENRVPCKPESVLRIASISKSVTMAAVARLWQKGDLDLDKPVQHYVPSFPEKTWNGEKVEITTRQLVSHLAGIRHYDKKYMDKDNAKDNSKDSTKEKSKEGSEHKSDKPSNQSESKSSSPRLSESTKKKDEKVLDECYLQQKFDSVNESLELFKNDPLVHKPGTQFLYSSHGWTLVSAVVEGAAKMSFEKYLLVMLQELGMESTYLDQNDPLIYNRGRHYVKNKGRLQNAPYVDISYKWAGGGLLSNVPDLLKFGNMMLYSYQAPIQETETDHRGNHQSESLPGATAKEDSSLAEAGLLLPGYLNKDTVKMLWTPVDKTQLLWRKNVDGRYGMGWAVLERKQEYGCCKNQKFLVSHTGGAIGGSSVLLIVPPASEELNKKGKQLDDVQRRLEGSNWKKSNVSADLSVLPDGMVIVIITNMVSVNLQPTATDIAEIFSQVDWTSEM